MPMSRKRSRVPSSRAFTTAARTRSIGSWTKAKRARKAYRSRAGLGARVARIERSIETKEGCWRVTNFQCAHNNLTVLNNSDGGVFNPFQTTSQGTSDPMVANTMFRIGDAISVRGLKLKFFLEASLGRSKVYFRIMLIKMAKGETLNRDNFFKNASGNKMIDQYNRERFTIVAQKVVNVSAANNVATSLVVATGVPLNATTGGLTGNRIVDMWIPGRKFGRNGVVQYENGSSTQVKFFDYRIAIVSYDWYGTPQDTNNVGFVNDGFCKLYFKDA